VNSPDLRQLATEAIRVNDCLVGPDRRERLAAAVIDAVVPLVEQRAYRRAADAIRARDPIDAALAGQHAWDDAAKTVLALADQPPGPARWTLPAEPGPEVSVRDRIGDFWDHEPTGWRCRRPLGAKWSWETLLKQGAPLVDATAGGSDQRHADLLEAFGHLKVQLWFCPVPGHSDSRTDADGHPAETVHWEGDVAHCTYPDCGRTSADRAEGGDQPETDPDLCPRSKRVDGPVHSWRFDGDDPRIECVYCGQLRDAHSGQVLRRGGDRDAG
jgi:hypothetical protein